MEDFNNGGDGVFLPRNAVGMMHRLRKSACAAFFILQPEGRGQRVRGRGLCGKQGEANVARGEGLTWQEGRAIWVCPLLFIEDWWLCFARFC